MSNTQYKIVEPKCIPSVGLSPDRIFFSGILMLGDLREEKMALEKGLRSSL